MRSNPFPNLYILDSANFVKCDQCSTLYRFANDFQLKDEAVISESQIERAPPPKKVNPSC